MASSPKTSTISARSRTLNWTNTIFLIATPLLAIVGAPVALSQADFSWEWIVLGVAMYLLTGISITAGYHRLFAHRSYRAHPWVERVVLFFGAGAFQGSVLKWATDHRDHHKHLDTELDPYSIQRGFFWAHMGWVFFAEPEGQAPRWVARAHDDLRANPRVLAQHRWILPISGAAGFGVPALLGALLGAQDPAIGAGVGALLGWFWGGLVRAVLTHHCTFFINSLCHYLGGRPYDPTITARDSAVMAFLTFGEGYHNFHHRFQGDYRNGIRPYHWDPTKWTIGLLASFGLASRLNRVSPSEILRARLSADALRLNSMGVPEDRYAKLRERLIEAQLRWRTLKADYQRVRTSAVARAELKQRELTQLRNQLRLEIRAAKLEFAHQRALWTELLRYELRRSRLKRAFVH